MSLSFLLLLFLSHLILSAWAHGEKHLAPKGQPGPAATGRNPGGAGGSRASRGTTSSSSSSVSAPRGASPGHRGSGLEQGSFQWSPSGRRTGSLYCRVGIGFHLQIYPDGKVNGSHEANLLSILEIFAVSQGIVGIRGVFSNKFLAMSKKGKLHASGSQIPTIQVFSAFFMRKKVSGLLKMYWESMRVGVDASLIAVRVRQSLR
ncbi:fibroblast growth factor 5 [Vulpes vulpes]|uniref:Fibroblast growth factor n=1 Tax=Vulpes vulpes TaxID=9627 RepID=A0ABM4ZGH2_VULVU